MAKVRGSAVPTALIMAGVVRQLLADAHLTGRPFGGIQDADEYPVAFGDNGVDRAPWGGGL
jgi:hypothetical protein